jgi:hypothetical protein
MCRNSKNVGINTSTGKYLASQLVSLSKVGQTNNDVGYLLVLQIIQKHETPLLPR